MKRKIYPFTVTIIILFFSGPSSPRVAHANSTCRDQVLNRLRKIPYEILLPPLGAKDQGDCDSCGGYAATTAIEGDILSYSGREIKINAAAVMASALKFEIYALLLEPDSELLTEQVSPIYAIEAASKTDSILPEKVWVPRITPERWGTEIFPTLNGKISQYRHGFEAIHENPELLAAEIERAKDVMYDYVDEGLGTPPETFEFENKRYSRRSFRQRWLPEEMRRISVRVDPERADSGKRIRKFSDLTLHQQLIYGTFAWVNSFAEIELLIQESLDGGDYPVFSMYADLNFVDLIRGLMSISAFPNARKPYDGRSHSGVLRGYGVDRQNSLARLKFISTWGRDCGINGEFEIAASFKGLTLPFPNRPRARPATPTLRLVGD